MTKSEWLASLTNEQLIEAHRREYRATERLLDIESRYREWRAVAQRRIARHQNDLCAIVDEAIRRELTL